MSGYGGQPPGGWNDPYGQNPYGQGGGAGKAGWDPYGQYGQSSYGYGPPGVSAPPVSEGNAIAALVCNILVTLFCCGIFGIAGIVTSAMAMSRVRTDPVSARKLTTWSWVIFGVSLVIGLIIIILYIVLIVAAESSGSGNI
ncbi:DUF4190 domain-containing protein [Spirillospora sp. NPDC047279]|uniref:DUF4190 domain-containing protein n=1 Tax=Spirillospora sp. NPDC047279 TaxID=3155478 RepID=UPI0033C02B29